MHVAGKCFEQRTHGTEYLHLSVCAWGVCQSLITNGLPAEAAARNNVPTLATQHTKMLYIQRAKLQRNNALNTLKQNKWPD
jgi:hypothetical protein